MTNRPFLRLLRLSSTLRQFKRCSMSPKVYVFILYYYFYIVCKFSICSVFLSKWLLSRSVDLKKSELKIKIIIRNGAKTISLPNLINNQTLSNDWPTYCHTLKSNMAARVHNVFSLAEILKIFLSETTKSIEL
jgi:hypothetical protein